MLIIKIKKRKGEKLTTSPLEAQDLAHFSVVRILGHLTTSSRAVGVQLNGAFDVQVGAQTARSPSDGSNLIGSEVVLGNGTNKVRGSRDLVGLSSEVVQGLVGSGNTTVDRDEATIVRRHDGVSPALGVVELNVQLTGLAVFGHRDSGANRSDEVVKDHGERLTIVGNALADRSVGTSSSSVGDVFNVNFIGRRAVGIGVVSGGTGSNESG